MKRYFKILIPFFLLLVISYFVFEKKKYYEKNQTVINCKVCVIKTEIKAIDMAEDTLFKVYGKSKIIKERPYIINLVDNKKWIISGSLNKNLIEKILYRDIPKFGGTFEIILDAKTGKVMNMIHYK